MLRNFSWVIRGRLAGMGLPTGAYWHLGGDKRNDELDEDLRSLKCKGVIAVVSLTLEPLHPATMRRFALTALHLPVDDMTAPTFDQMTRCAEFVDRTPAESGAVVHCNAGMGRTGTMLAACLIWTGETAENAMYRIRRLRPGSIETVEQELAIIEFEAYIRNRRRNRQT